MNHSTSRWGIGLLAGAMAIALTGCAGGGSTPDSSGGGRVDSPGVTADTITIGTVSDQTGPTAGIQLPWLHGVQSAVAAINDAGGVNGRDLELLSEDDKYDVAIGQPAFKKLIDQTPAAAILGLNTGNTQAAIQPLIDASAVPVLSGQTTTLAAVDPPMAYFFGLAPTYEDQVKAMYAYTPDRLGTDDYRVAVIDNGAATGVEVRDLVEELATGGAEYVGEVVIEPGVTTVDAQWQSVMALEPDTVFFHGTSSAVNLIARAQEKFGSEIPLLGISPSGGPSAFAGATPEYGNLFEYVQWATPAPIEAEGTADMEAAAKLAGYEDEVNNPDFVAGYAAGLVIAEAISIAGESDPNREAIGDALESLTDFSTGGLTPDVSFSDTDRVGVQELRPLAWDYDTSSFVAIGDFGDYVYE